MSDQETQTNLPKTEGGVAKTRGRKPLPASQRRIGRYITCPHCTDAFYYDYRDKSFGVDSEKKKKIRSSIENNDDMGDLLPDLQSNKD